MRLSRIVMRLARNPGTEFAGGDDHRGYALTAPLTDEGLLDEAAYGKAKDACHVRRFAPDETTFRSWRHTPSPGCRSGIGCRRRRSQPRISPGSSGTIGRATSASCRTCSSAP